MLPWRRKGRRRCRRAGGFIQRRSYEAVKRNITPGHFFPQWRTVEREISQTTGVLTVLGIRWLSRLWLRLYHQVRQDGNVNKVENVPDTTLQPLFKQVAGKRFMAFSQNTVTLYSHCTPTTEHCTPLKKTFFHTIPRGPHLIFPDNIQFQQKKTAAPPRVSRGCACALLWLLPPSFLFYFLCNQPLAWDKNQLRHEFYITPAHSDIFHPLNESWRGSLLQRALSAL